MCHGSPWIRGRATQDCIPCAQGNKSRLLPERHPDSPPPPPPNDSFPLHRSAAEPCASGGCHISITSLEQMAAHKSGAHPGGHERRTRGPQRLQVAARGRPSLIDCIPLPTRAREHYIRTRHMPRWRTRTQALPSDTISTAHSPAQWPHPLPSPPATSPPPDPLRRRPPLLSRQPTRRLVQCIPYRRPRLLPWVTLPPPP